MSRKKIDLYLENVEIESVAAEGRALAHVNGQVIFTEFAVPGDIVNIHVTKKKKKYMEGRITEITRKSEHRTDAFCEHFGVCGGCKWQPLPYSMQLDAKQQQVYDQLVRIGHLDVPEISPIAGSGQTTFYRNKLEFSFSSKRWILKDEEADKIPDSDRGGLGFHVSKFFDKVLDIKKCHLQKDPSNAIRLFIKKYATDNNLQFYDIRENTGYLRNMFIRTTEENEVMVIMCFAYADEESHTKLFKSLLNEFPQITSLYYVINDKLNDSITDRECNLFYGKEYITEKMEGLQFRIGPKSFYQTNSRQALKLYTITRDFANLTGNEIVYDLYTGTGTIAQFVASKAYKVVGIEYVKEAIEDAKANAEQNNIDNCTFIAGDMKDILTTEFINEHGKPDVIILDPPRAGIHPDVAKTILETNPDRIVYVSCNPASQARDLGILCEKYKIVKVQPVDMFPHTQHVENVVLLTKSDSGGKIGS